jgi:tetratricopeptide (TPR) repeat protein
MKQVACSECQQLAPMSETLLVKQQHVCSGCIEGVLSQAAEKGITKADVFRASDPTVCTQCKTDNGNEELPRLAGLPVCETCGERFRNRPYPAWLKLSFAALVGLAIFSFAWNWRFMAAFREMRQLARAMKAQDVDKAADCAERAAHHLPEFPEMAAGASLYRGMALLSHNQPAKAVECLRKAKGAHVDLGPAVDQMLVHAEASAAFDTKNYDEFLAKSKILATRWPSASTVAALASAYACKYAVTGSEEFRKQAEENLKKAMRMAGPKDADAQEYQSRIQFRIDTREIISQDEFKRRFPNGYQAKAKS